MTDAQGTRGNEATMLREALAAYAHEAWSGWMKYMFEKGEFRQHVNPRTLAEEEIWVMPAWAVERWQRQMNTPFSALPDAEKESDYEEADKMLAIVERTPVAATTQGQPMPDWTQAPEWAQWWAVDANGQSMWYRVEPYCDDDEGACWCGQFDDKGDYDSGMFCERHTTLPLGIDWRTTLTPRPQPWDAAKEEGERDG